jgi:hypothetical protein
LVDERMESWPQHARVKQMQTRSERLEFWNDARRKMAVACTRNDEFSAGVAFGHDLAMYRVMLLRAEESVPRP